MNDFDERSTHTHIHKRNVCILRLRENVLRGHVVTIIFFRSYVCKFYIFLALNLTKVFRIFNVIFNMFRFTLRLNSFDTSRFFFLLNFFCLILWFIRRRTYVYN